MIMHTVAFGLNPKLSEEEKSNQFEKIKLEMEKFAVLEGVKDITVYPLMKTSEYDLAMVAVFENKEAFEAYQNNSDHKASQVLYKDVLVSRTAIDYVMD